MANNSFNQVVLEGYLGNDPETRFTPTGKQVASFRIALNESWTDSEGQAKEHTSWVTVEAWNGLGETVGKYLKKGRRVLVAGRLRTDVAGEGDERRYYTKIVAQNVRFLDAPRNDNGDPAPEPEGENIPF